MLTDSRPLNTLYLDKNLIWHTLVQGVEPHEPADKATARAGNRRRRTTRRSSPAMAT
ncbi:MAG: hypothetical protein ACLRVN_06060 [Butyricicoccus sp.]